MVQVQAGAKEWPFLQSITTNSGAQLVQHLQDTGTLYIKLTTHLHLAPKLKKSTALHLCRLCLQVMHRDNFTLYIK